MSVSFVSPFICSNFPTSLTGASNKFFRASRAVDPHSLFADLDPAAFQMRIWIRIQLQKLIKKLPPYEEFSLVEKTYKRLVKRNNGACANLL